MKIYTTKKEIDNYILQIKETCKKIGFVPTMGALHQGHISLVKQALAETDIVVVSIFVNPKQFNNPTDLIKYPRTIEHDLRLLEENGCHVVFMPTNDEMYANQIERTYDLGYLDSVLEGKFRPGHFNGVALVVDLLVELIKPDMAYFGEKDYQQLAVIKRLVYLKNMPVEIVSCQIIREADGLAMSSRNMRLTDSQRLKAPLIYKILSQAKQRMSNFSPKEIKEWITNQINQVDGFNFEYFELVDTTTFKTIDKWDDSSKIIGLIVVNLGEIRLIDNLIFIDE